MTITGTAPAMQALPGPKGRANLRLMRQFLSDPVPALEQMRSFGPVCAFGVPPMRMVAIGDPRIIHRLLTMKAETFRWNHIAQRIGPAFVVGKTTMLASDGADHRRRRGAVQKGLTRPRLDRWAPMIVDRTDAALDRLLDRHGNGAMVDLYPVGREIIIGITIHALFGERMAQRSAEFSELFRRPQAFIEQSAVRQLPHPLPATKRAQVRADRAALHRLIDSEIAERRTNPAGDPCDVLEAIVTDGTLSDAEIRDQVTTLIGAGYDTTAASFAWLLWRTTLTPGVWSGLRAETDRVFASAAEPIGPNTLAALELAGRCVRESLRLHPAGAAGVRKAVVDIDVGGYRIPAGSMVVWSPYLAGRDPEVWTDAEQFIPNRYLHLTEQQAALADQAWVPFGRGPHMCIGFALAQMEMTLMLACFAQRLDLNAPAAEVPRPNGLIVNRPTGGAPFAVNARRIV